MKHNLSVPLRAFLTHWLEWVEGGAQRGMPFCRNEGLCVSAAKVHYAIRDELQAKFEIEFLRAHDFYSHRYPFGGRHQYRVEEELSTIHENPHRLAWVKEQLS